ncbi:MAG: sigma 54-interacting transcriptional regulator [Anaerovoracaceae bacterium]|nr:sigma 54-interacting transcriptional regulator [Anaerovoracaceae bacterium]
MDEKKTELLKHGLEEILEASFDGIMVTDGEGNCIFANSSYTRNTGITNAEIVGHNVRELLNPIWMKDSIALEVIEKRGSVSMEHDTKNGNHILVTGTPIFNENGEIEKVVVNTRDLSEINHLKLKLGEAQAMEKIYLKSMGISKELVNINDETVVINNRMRDIYEVAKRVSTYNTTVLITGESGTGKELVARYIHKEDSIRKDKPFVVINCGAIPANLLESELFGYTEGSFTGAIKGGKKGLFEQAEGGVIFLDEIGEMDLSLQVKLLRVLETRSIMKIGQPEEIPVNVRIIAATNRDLEKEVREDRFRDDLYYRLNVVSLRVPPLRERIDEIVPLATKFINKFNKLYGQEKKLTYDLVCELEAYNWPGNIRELKNVMENMVVISNSEYLRSGDLPWIRQDENRSDGMPTLKEAVEEFEKQFLKKAKEQWGTTEKMAQALDVNQSTISRKLNKYNI